MSKVEKHDWKMGVGPWKRCARCGVIANRITGGWAYKDGATNKELGTTQPPCKGGD